MVVKALTMEMFHAKQNVGSTKIRIRNMMKYWPDLSLYRYGDKPDVLIFQKVYVNKDYTFPKTFPGIKILDIADPDWLDGVPIKETIDAMDAVVVPTEPLAEFLRQMTDKPVRVIKDRFDLSEFPERKVHRGTAKELVWFGYKHNSSCLKLAIQSFERRGLKLRIVSDQDPFADKWAKDPKEFSKDYVFKKYRPDMAYKEIQKSDICVLPKMTRPQDRFKSENKTVIAQLLGLPVATTADELDELVTPEQRNSYIDTVYDDLKVAYDCNKSVSEYKQLISELKQDGV